MRCICRLLPLLFLLLLPFACRSTPEMLNDEAFESLVKAERSFANTALVSGTRAAFLEFFADQGVVFNAGPINARSFWEQRPTEGPVLVWAPEIADVSEAGDMGFTSGPYEVRETPESAPVAWGHFVSVWRRTADSSWHVIADGGVHHGPVAVALDRVVERVGAADGWSTMARNEPEASRIELAAADSAYSRSMVETGLHEFMEAFVDGSTRFYRNGRLPVLGVESISTVGAHAGHQWNDWEQRDVIVARSADLGCSYGIAEFAVDSGDNDSESHASYYRIWERSTDSTWRVALDVLMPFLPRPSDSQ